LEITLEDTAMHELEGILQAGCVEFDGVRVVYDDLPGRAICAITVCDGTLWLAVDLDKPSAPRHALAMIRELQHWRHCAEHAAQRRVKLLALAG